MSFNTIEKSKLLSAYELMNKINSHRKKARLSLGSIDSERTADTISSLKTQRKRRLSNFSPVVARTNLLVPETKPKIKRRAFTSPLPNRPRPENSNYREINLTSEQISSIFDNCKRRVKESKIRNGRFFSPLKLGLKAKVCLSPRRDFKPLESEDKSEAFQTPKQKENKIKLSVRRQPRRTVARRGFS